MVTCSVPAQCLVGACSGQLVLSSKPCGFLLGRQLVGAWLGPGRGLVRGLVRGWLGPGQGLVGAWSWPGPGLVARTVHGQGCVVARFQHPPCSIPNDKTWYL